MKTKNIGVIMEQGADFSLVIEIDGVGGPIDLTNYQFKGQMRPSTQVSNPVAAPVAEFSFEILNQTTSKGKVRWYLAKAGIDAVVASISDGLQKNRLTTPFVFDIKMKDTASVVSRIIQGIIYVSPQGTQEDFA